VSIGSGVAVVNESAFDTTSIHLPSPPARIHIVGIGGAGMSGLARMLASRGYAISGSDIAKSPATDELQAAGMRVAIGHRTEHILGANLVAINAAIRGDNPEVVAAAERGIPVVKGKALWGLLANDAVCFAVAGSHGKSTTSGMAALALERAGLDPSFAVGATVRELGTNAKLGAGPHFVVEADEYDYSFLWLRPSVAVVTNIEHDHPDLFPDLDAVIGAFERFIGGIRRDGMLVISADDAGCRRLLERMTMTGAVRIVTFGMVDGDWRIAPRADGSGQVTGPNGQMFALRLAVPGRHNLLNALAVLASADGLGVEPGMLLPGLEAFSGVSRRFEIQRDTPELVVVSDYAHHPTEIAATIAAARERYPGRRVMVVFQPHTYSRTKALLDAFAAALDTADEVVLADIYPSRETDTLGISSGDIAARMARPITPAASPEAAARTARTALRAGDVALVLGAGDIDRAALLLARGGGA
jgi:UDP-N-acetylmuramate--alanine ligase